MVSNSCLRAEMATAGATLSFMVVKSSLARMLANDGKIDGKSDKIERGASGIRSGYLLNASK